MSSDGCACSGHCSSACSGHCSSARSVVSVEPSTPPAQRDTSLAESSSGTAQLAAVLVVATPVQGGGNCGDTCCASGAPYLGFPTFCRVAASDKWEVEPCPRSEIDNDEALVAYRWPEHAEHPPGLPHFCFPPTLRRGAPSTYHFSFTEADGTRRFASALSCLALGAALRGDSSPADDGGSCGGGRGGGAIDGGGTAAATSSAAASIV
eukprot:5907540-Prymnesium_polylepis.1